MPTKLYSDFIEISPTFESVVDIDADSRNANLWQEYIVGEDMEKLLEAMCQSFNNEGPDMRRSFWIEGTYGTGKTYAAILVKHLMEERPEVLDSFMMKNPRLAKYCKRFLKCRSKGDHLVVWKTGCTGLRDGNALLMELELAVREALAQKFGDHADYGEGSLYAAVKQQVRNPVLNWQHILDTTVLGDDYPTVEQLQKAVDSNNLKALQTTAAIIRRYNWGLIDSLDTFKNWITSVIENNGLSQSGILVIWDEFTEYVAASDDITLLQQLSEFCKVKPFFLLFVLHRTTEIVERITPERYQLIKHRFHQVEFHISTEASFDLIAGSIHIRNGMANHWKDERHGVIQSIQRFLPNMEGLDDKISKMIEQLCPMHPMTIKLLSRVAENYAASQRTMFKFMKDQSAQEHGFVGYINNYGPDSQANWLTPDWLWDYFFTRESDFSDKDTRAAEYIRHYEESVDLVKNDENALRVFRTAMLLLALMSTTKGIYSGARSRDGIAATVECLNNCLAGVMDERVVGDLLATMEDSRILVLDQDSRGNVRLQLPFKGTNQDDFSAKLSANDKKYSRYKMFSKEGEAAQLFEKQAWEDTDAMYRRMKLAVCCAETSSINTRLAEIDKELEKSPHKLGLLIVTVDSDPQVIPAQTTLQAKVPNLQHPDRMILALMKNPLTEEKRRQWLAAVTKQEMAGDAGQTGAQNQYKVEAQTVLSSWVSGAVSGGKMIAFYQNQVFHNLYGMANLRSTINKQVLRTLFPYAPETIVSTSTVFKACNESAPTAGIQRSSNSSQLTNVLNVLKLHNLLELTSIDELCDKTGDKAVESVVAVAKMLREEMESGRKVSLSEIWERLQKPPFGYYDTIACGVLLGYLFSFYKMSKYTWVDSAQSPQILAEAVIGRMVVSLCKGKMTTDFLSSGTETWRKFSDYLGKIFGLPEVQLAQQTLGCHNVREAVTKSGAPFWALKYLPAEAWNNEELRQTADKVIDCIQVFISQVGDVEEAMRNALQLMHGRGKMRLVLTEHFQSKSSMAKAFRTFLFETSPDLKEIAEKLAVQPEELSDKLHSVMQGAIYTWTEAQVAEKLQDVADEYRYLDVLGQVLKKTYHSVEAAKRDLTNQFKYLRISISAIEQLHQPWFPALEILYKISVGGAAHQSAQARQSDMEALAQYGSYAMGCLTDGKSILADILAAMNADCTAEELDSVYAGLKEMPCNATLPQFNRELRMQLNSIGQARNRIALQEEWRARSGKDSVRAWCAAHNTPILWIVNKEQQKAFDTLLKVQRNQRVVDTDVTKAIQVLQAMDVALLTDDAKINQAFLNTVGAEYADIWNAEGIQLLSKAQLKLGNDMSEWSTSELSGLQRMLKQAMQEKAKKEKLADAKRQVKAMGENTLRDRVSNFLNEHPEYCEYFVG